MGALSSTIRRSPPHPANSPASLPHPRPSPSFWSSPPAPFLRNHRTTPELPRSTDVLIIGSGISGANVARFLTEDDAGGLKERGGPEVLVLEAREACDGATGRNGGHCQPLLYGRSADLDGDLDLARFELRNFAHIESLVGVHAILCEWRAGTACRTYLTPALFSAARDAVTALKERDPELGARLTVLDAEREADAAVLAEHFVRTGDGGCAGAVLVRGAAASLSPYKLVAWMLERLVRRGRINLQTNTPVTSIRCVSANSSYPYVVQTPRGDVTARHVVLTTNGYTSRLLPGCAELIVPVLATMTALTPPPPPTQGGVEVRLPDTYGFVGADGQSGVLDDYLVQRPFATSAAGSDREEAKEGEEKKGGQLMFGGGRGVATHPSVGNSDDSVPGDEGSTRHLRRTLPRVLNLPGESEEEEEQEEEELHAQKEWSGVMGWSRDGAPWVGRVPDSFLLDDTTGSDSDGMTDEQQRGQDRAVTSGIWLCAGFSGHGMPNATLCARALASMILDDGSAPSDRDLPAAYGISAERLGRARGFPIVANERAYWERRGL